MKNLHFLRSAGVQKNIMFLEGVLLFLSAILLCNGQSSMRCQNTGDIRLIGGANLREGRVEVCVNNVWGTVCDDLWGSEDATVVCRQLGFLQSSAIPVSSAYFGEGIGPIHLDNVECEGSESSLTQCAHQGITQNCQHSEDASVICLSENSTCTDGDIRLSGSDRENEGRVEICFNNQYGTVCDDGWDNVDASVVCGQLGFQREGALGVRQAQLFGRGFGIIYFDDVNCNGNEANLTLCQHRGVAVSNCNHREDAGVVCKPNTTAVVCNDSDIRLSNGRTSNEGRVEICYSDHWGTVCDDAWDENDAQVVCRQLGFPANGSKALVGAAYGEGDGLIFLDSVRCIGTENILDQCEADEVGVHNCGHREDAGVICQSSALEHQCEEGRIRLVNGPDGRKYEGRLEICIQNHWGTICDDRYNIEEATVVCRQLGFTNGVALPLPRAFFGEGVGMIWLDELGCTGTEASLLNCTHGGIGQTDCRHTEDVSIICPLPQGAHRECENGEIRLVGGEMSNEGRVELCFNGRWGTVCDDNWGQSDAAVACRQLGFSNATMKNSLAAIGALYGPGEGLIILDNVACEGNEESLLACSAEELGINNCNHREDAGVLCPVEDASRRCTDGEVRLMDGSKQGEGRVEMCFNGKWGSVCSTGFNEMAAEVTCRNLGFNIKTTRSIPILSGSFGPAKTPIILSDLTCTGSEETLLQCPDTTVAIQRSCQLGANAAAVICTELPCTNGTFRLVGGDSMATGRVEVCVAETWGTVCANNVNDSIASQICTSLGQQGTDFTQASGDVFGPSSVPTFTITTDTGGLSFTEQATCGQEGSAIIFCLAKGEAQLCRSGDIRLADGSGSFEGRVEVCFNNVWGTVCDDSWDDKAAAVVCRQLGQQYQGAKANAFGGAQSLPILLDDMKCAGDELNLFQCTRTNLGAHNCKHIEDAGVTCLAAADKASTNINEVAAISIPIVIVIVLLLLAIITVATLVTYTRHKMKSQQSDTMPIVEADAGIPTKDFQCEKTKINYEDQV